jgi:ribosome biogenesis protein MAK21
MYLNLLFKSIKADAGNMGGERIKAIVRRFVQVLVSGGSGATEFIAGGLFLLGEVRLITEWYLQLTYAVLLAIQQHSWSAEHAQRCNSRRCK